jgi:hypothetical protein
MLLLGYEQPVSENFKTAVLSLAWRGVRRRYLDSHDRNISFGRRCALA